LRELKPRYDLVRDVLLSQLRYYPIPALAAVAANAPSVPIPSDLASFLSYDAVAKRVRVSGLITTPQGQALAALWPPAAPYVNGFIQQSEKVARDHRDLFEPDMARAILDSPRSDDVIAGALHCLARLLETDVLTSSLAAVLELDQRLCAALVDNVEARATITPGGSTRTASEVLFDDVMLSSAPGSSIDTPQFAPQFEVLTRLNKAALL